MAHAAGLTTSSSQDREKQPLDSLRHRPSSALAPLRFRNRFLSAALTLFCIVLDATQRLMALFFIGTIIAILVIAFARGIGVIDYAVDMCVRVQWY